MVRSRTLTFLALLVTTACSQEPKPLTQLVLVADTDVASVDAVQFLIRSDDGARSEMSTVPRNGTDSAYVSVVREEGPLGPLLVASFALQNGERTGLVRVQRVSFVPDQTRVVKLHLAASCIGKSCAESDTCSETGCVPIDESELSPWDGTAPRIGDVTPADASTPKIDGGDAATSDAGPDGALHDAGTADASTDAGQIDAGPADAGAPDSGLTACSGGSYDLNTNPYHCGKTCAMAVVCANGAQANSINACIAGACCVPTPIGIFNKCELETGKAVCKTNYGDCFDDSTTFPAKANSCETYLADDINNCGACGKKCLDVGKTSCVLGTCQ